MNLQLVITFFIVLHLRKTFQTASMLPIWNRRFLGILYTCIALQVLDFSVPIAKPAITIFSYVIVFGMIGIIYVEKEFERARSTLFAVLPLILVSFIGGLIKLINMPFYKRWDDLFGAITSFAVIWMITILIINRKQRKALEKERLKTQEEERQNKIMATLKAELEVQVAERTAALTLQKEELQHTLDELKATQKQLIQSEKMASLGELTAGIAHEIQNPLNFVTNFSEINAELLLEMKEEIEKGNLEEVKLIANDIAANEQKINHHGKRADAIVKGMLQHSRSSGGQKEPTDINALADEYLRLAYHGLRAKDKSFNATLKTDFDESIGNINIIPQDMGRVILNLITNAFYAAPLPPEGGFLDPDYVHSPTVWVSTKKGGNNVLISVKDNGPGIPQKLLDKIFQPFFTTKPTGQGTGLGLSLSYDIVKAHGGEIKVNTKENEGTEFIISLPL
jgi:signal transduction histidine kinase